MLKQHDIRLIGLDLDGTLFNDQKVITPHTLDVLTRAMEQGVTVIPATGRSVSGLPAQLTALPGLRYALTSNGANVADLKTGESIAAFPLSPELTAQVLDVFARYDCLPSLFSDQKRICPVGDRERLQDYVPANMLTYIRDACCPVPDLQDYALHSGRIVEKANAFFRTHEEQQAAWKELQRTVPDVVIASSLGANMEVNAPGVTKGRSILVLAEYLGLTADQVMTCGDSGNDLDMICRAGLGVAMANSTPEVLAAADYVTLSNQEDGVAAAIEKFVL